MTLTNGYDNIVNDTENKMIDATLEIKICIENELRDELKHYMKTNGMRPPGSKMETYRRRYGQG